MLKNAGPALNLESDKMGHLVFMGESDSELFSLPNWQERPFSSPPPVAPPIIISEISEKSEMIIGGATGEMMKMAFLVSLTSWKAQNLIVPWKLDDPFCQISNLAQGWHLWASWSLHIFGFVTSAKKIYVSWVWNYVPYHVKVQIFPDTTYIFTFFKV